MNLTHPVKYHFLPLLDQLVLFVLLQLIQSPPRNPFLSLLGKILGLLGSDGAHSPCREREKPPRQGRSGSSPVFCWLQGQITLLHRSILSNDKMPALHLRVLAPDVSRVQGDLQALQGFSLCLGVCELLRLLAKGQVVPLILPACWRMRALFCSSTIQDFPPFLPRAINLGKSSLELIPGHRRLPRIEQFPFRRNPQSGSFRLK